MKINVINIFLILSIVFAPLATTLAQTFGDFYFKEAQPRKEESLTRFPSSIRGLYISTKDSTKRLVITGDTVAFEIPMVQYATMTEINAKHYTFRDSVVIKPNGVELPCMQKHDTVFFVDFAKSIIFSVGENQVIKKAGDKFILSKQTSEGKWDCFLLYKENDNILIAFFDFDKKTTEISENKKIEKVKQSEGNYYLANMKLKDFQKLIDKEYFPRKQYFHKRFDL